MSAVVKLVASLIVRNELGRYLEPCVGHLLEFCDEIRVLNDGSDDGTEDYLMGLTARRVRPLHMSDSRFYHHEGDRRQRLLDWTLKGDPTHILAVDADEFVADGPLLRKNIAAAPHVAVWSLCMQEIWKAAPDALCVRQDGGWAEHDVPILYRPDGLVGPLRMPDRALASGRTPDALRRATSRAHTCTAVLHFGWTNEAERAARYERYVEHDGGRFHARQHLDSIMWPDSRVTLTDRAWPDGLLPYHDAVVAHAGVTGVAG